MLNRYMDEDLIRRRLDDEGHRRVVGGLWDQMGALQLSFLRDQGLSPGDRLLDVGCGALRAGAPIVGYLEPGGYYGIDISPSLLDAGHAHEIVAAGLGGRLPRDHLHATDDFEVPFGVAFDFGLATSLFTHLPLAFYTRALERTAPVFRPGARFFATVFEGHGPDVEQQAGIVSHDDRDPFHFTREALDAATPDGWRFDWIGDWTHPRGQQMVRLTRE